MIYETNKCTEYAMKDSEGNELSKVNTVESIPVLTNASALEIFNKKPKFVVYDDIVFILQDLSESNTSLYYSSIYGTVTSGLELTLEDDEVSITKDSGSLATISDIKPIYWHGLTIFSGSTVAFGHILKNDNTLINDVASLISWFNSISGEVIFPVTGNISFNSNLYIVLAIIKRSTDRFDILYLDGNNERHDITNATLGDYFTGCNDSSNKIN